MTEPVSIDLARAQCRVEAGDAEDALLNQFIAAAREYVEGDTGQTLVQRELVEHHPGFGCPLVLRAWPIVTVDQVAYVDAEGEPQAIAAADTRLVRGNRPGRLYPARDATWPTISCAEGVEVTVTAGYAADAVPPKLVQAILLLVDHWYENRGAVVVGTISKEVEFAVSALCERFRLITVA